MKAIWMAIALCCAAMSAQSASAGDAPAGRAHPLMDRLDASMGHIQDAYKAGDLTREERDHLKNQFQTILAVTRRYIATGGLDDGERADLRRMLDNLDLRLRREVQDGQRRS